jgi:hypothetical protein
MEKYIPISEPLVNLPDNCQFVDLHTILCSKGEEGADLCEIIEGNELLCGSENQECEITESGVSCKHIAESIDLKSETRPTMQDVFVGHAYLVVVAAILSLALTQIIKPFIFKTCNEKSDAVIRLFAVLTGAGIAYTLSKPFMMIDVYMGACAGAINAFVIKMFKAKVKKSLGVEDTPEPKKEADDE